MRYVDSWQNYKPCSDRFVVPDLALTSYWLTSVSQETQLTDVEQVMLESMLAAPQ